MVLTEALFFSRYAGFEPAENVPVFLNCGTPPPAKMLPKPTFSSLVALTCGMPGSSTRRAVFRVVSVDGMSATRARMRDAGQESGTHGGAVVHSWMSHASGVLRRPLRAPAPAGLSQPVAPRQNCSGTRRSCHLACPPTSPGRERCGRQRGYTQHRQRGELPSEETAWVGVPFERSLFGTA